MLIGRINVRLALCTVILLFGVGCIIIGNLVGKTMIMSLGIISIPTSIVLLNPLAQKAVKWIDSVSEN
ncbi:MAG: hypothetical protein CL793_03610 [Chloroflexi bacterium]|nr:hypothetical protein [Chloroflexota bacterium]